MGRVFSPEEVWDGVVPVEQNARLAGAMLLHAFFDAPEKHDIPPEVAEAITSGLVFGSVAMDVDGDKVSRRSDVDIHVNYRPPAGLATDDPRAIRTNQRIAGTISGHAEKLGERLRVPIGLFLCHEGELDTLNPFPRVIRAGDDPFVYTWDEILFRHLDRMQTNHPEWSRNHPIKPGRAAQPINEYLTAYGAAEYMDRREQHLARRQANEIFDTTTMQAALGIPRATARQVSGILEGVDGAMKAIEDTPWALYWLANHPLQNEEECAAVQRLVELDNEYSALLEETLNRPSEAGFAAYERWLCDNTPEATRLAHLVARRWADVALDVVYDIYDRQESAWPSPANLNVRRKYPAVLAEGLVTG